MTIEDDVLVWFSCHPDYHRFRLAELTSIAQILGVQPERLWERPSHDKSAIPGIEVPWSGDQIQNCSREKIIKYAENGSEAAITLGDDDSVFVFVRIDSNIQERVAKEIVNRSVLTKGIAKIWTHGPSYESIIQTLKSTPHSKIHQYINPSKTFSFLVDTFGHHLTQKQQIDRMGNFTFLFSGKERADLKNPDVQLVLFEKWVRSEQIADPVLEYVYFGRAIACRPKSVLWWWNYRLAIRPVLGPTTMDNELAFIMANQAQIKPGMIVLDPFCGTGGLLISTTHFGATCFGSDIDTRVLKGWGVCQLNSNIQHKRGASSDIFRNFDEYGLIRPEIIRMDVAAWTHFQRKRAINNSSPSLIKTIRPWVDAIVTDPPYGIRASVREVSSSKSSDQSTNDSPLVSNFVDQELLPINDPLVHKSSFIPATATSTVNAVMTDLFHLASSLLVDNGKLVFLYPVQLSEVNEQLNALDHPDLVLEFASLQRLSAGMGRVLATMRRKPRRQ